MSTPLFTLTDTIINSIMAICIGYLIALAVHSDDWESTEDEEEPRTPRWPDHG